MDNLRWDLTSIFTTDEEVRLDFDTLEKMYSQAVELKKDIKGNIVELLKKYADIERLLYKVYVFAHLKKDEDSNVTKYQKLESEASNLSNKISTEFSFLQPFLLSLSNEEVRELVNNPELKDFDVFLNKIFRYKEYTLSDKEEKIIAELSVATRTASSTYNYLVNTDIKFPYLENFDVQIENNNFVKLQMNENRELRKEVFTNFYNSYNQFANSISTLYYSHINALSKISNIRGYDSVRQMYLYRDDVDESVYDALIESVHDNLKHLHKYYEIKKRALGLDEQHMYDVYMPITGDFEKTYTFEEAKQLILESVKPLGKEYGEIVERAFNERWIDVEPRKGKRGGAYSSGSYDTKPFILMNFNGTLDSVFTLAHELGHSLHSYYDRNNNDFLHSGYTIFVAEVASTFNEALLLDLLMKNASSDKERLYLIDFYLNSFKSTVFRQTMFAEFEREVHSRIEKGEALTKDDFSNIYLELNKKYFGDAMVSDAEIAYEWQRIPHFYSNFYVYKYATGFSASSILSKWVLENRAGALENYIEFLKDGNKHFPIEQLKIAGVDMGNPESVNEALSIFAEYVDKLDKMIK